MGKNLFNSVKMTKPKKSVFDLSHDVKLSLKMGQLVPIMCMETVPGDKIRISCESLLRFQPLIAPVMHRFDVTMHYFFVPNRLTWAGWEDFITNTPTAGVLPAVPTVIVNNDTYVANPVMDYMGIPNNTGPTDLAVSALPFAAYQMIYNEYYRDQNLIPEVNYKLVNGDNSSNLASLGALRRRAWEHDYFTSALPFAQKGPAVDLPLGVVELKEDWDDPAAFPKFRGFLGGSQTGDVTQVSYGGTPEENATTVGLKGAYDPDGTLEVGATTINDLRRAFKLQEWLEKTARAGSRYVENILGHFGVRSDDARMQRPEYITGIKSPVVISEVLNTAGDPGARPQGDMAGHAVSVTQGNYGKYFCKEHGYVIGIMSVMPKTAYQQGIPKHFLKFEDPLQFYWPSFAHLGEQEVFTREVYAHASLDEKKVFGYVPRYAEYKFLQNRVAGDFRTTLDFWHEGRIFDTEPLLNKDFIECNPSDRIFAVTDPAAQNLLCHVYNKVTAVRPMPKFGTPSF